MPTVKPTIKEHVKHGVKKIAQGAKSNEPEYQERYADQILVNTAAYCMKEALDTAREDKGRKGWWNSKELSKTDLNKQFAEAVKEKDYVKVMSLAAMELFRESE